jgi:hypothetical protein
MGKHVLAVILLSLAIVVSLAIHSVSAQPESSVTTDIQGVQTLWQKSIDPCLGIILQSCPVTLTVSESFSETVSTYISTQNQILTPGNTAQLQLSLEPSSTYAELTFTFGVFQNHSIMFQAPVPSVGGVTDQLQQINLGQLLGLPLSLYLTPEVTVSNTLYEDFQTTGFTGPSTTEWSDQNQLSNTLELTFNGDTPNATFALFTAGSTQSWEANLVLTGPAGLLNKTIMLYATTVSFLGDPLNGLAWYQVTISSPQGGAVSPAPSTAWYLDGYQLQLQASANSGYVFEGWSINGQILSTSAIYTYTVSAPTSITPEFSQQPQQPSNSGSQPAQNTQPVSVPPATANPAGINPNILVVSTVILGSAVIVYFSLRRRK